jgi:hypothetical protein
LLGEFLRRIGFQFSINLLLTYQEEFMPQCRKCGKKGLFLKIEEDTGLCLPCNESFAQEGKILTEKIAAAKNAAINAKDPEEIARYCQVLEDHGNRLVALHQTYNLQPSQGLLDLIETHKKMRGSAEKQSGKKVSAD